MNFALFLEQLTARSGTLPVVALLLCLLPLQVRGQGGAAHEVSLIPEGDRLEYRTQSSVPVPEDWFSNPSSLGWPLGVSGFGPPARYREFGTLLPFKGMKIRKTFHLDSMPVALKLSLRHEDYTPFQLYLNGSLVHSQGSGKGAVPDAKGFRHFDLSSGLDRLVLGSNLFALAVGGILAVPVLSGQFPDPDSYPLTAKTGDAFREEGTAFEFEVRREEQQAVQLVELDLGTAGAGLADLEVWQDGVPLALSFDGQRYRFSVRFPDASEGAVLQLRIRDDSHAEALERIEILADSSRLYCLIPPNDTNVSRTSAAGEGTLKQAIANANQHPDPNVIRFVDEEGVPFTSQPVSIILTPGVENLNIAGGVEIEGPDTPGRVTIQANGGRVFHARSVPGEVRSPMVLRRLVIQNAFTALETSRHEENVLVEDCEFIQNGNPLNLYNLSGSVAIRNSLFTDCNTAVNFYNSGIPSAKLVSNCTFIGNRVVMANAYSIEATHCTIVDSGGIGLRTKLGSLTNSILAGSYPGGKSSANSWTDAGGNLFRENPAGHPDSRGGTPDQPLEPGLEPLAFRGGFTRTMALKGDSPALDLGAFSPAEPAHDQRGAGFLRKVGRAPDAGAYERQLASADLVIGLATEAEDDPSSGLYVQFISVTNRSPWELSGFRLVVEALPPGVVIFNGPGGNALDVARTLPPGVPAYFLIQYRAESPWLRIEPRLQIEVLPGATDPAVSPEPVSIQLVRSPAGEIMLEMTVPPQRSYQVQYANHLNQWMAAGPAIFAETRQLRWCDDGRVTGSAPSLSPHRFYRVVGF